MGYCRFSVGRKDGGITRARDPIIPVTRPVTRTSPKGGECRYRSSLVPTLPDEHLLGSIYSMLVDYRRYTCINEYIGTFREAQRRSQALSQLHLAQNPTAGILLL